MSQNINLFPPALRKRRQRLSFALAARIVGLAAAMLAAGAFYLDYAARELGAELRAVQGVLEAQRAELERLKAQAAARRPDPALEAEIVRLQAEAAQAREAMAALQSGALGAEQGFSEYLRAFSRQSLAGLWLTGFSISAGGELEIRGRVLRPELVPSYIQRLNREKVLAGRSFARLEMGEPSTEPGRKEESKPKAERAPRVVEFSLATAEAPRAEKTP